MPDLFPSARSMERHFIIHIGPTNSGKTYCSVERLKAAKRGIYLGPLRLLAYEQYQKLNEQGFPCSLYTGEEHQIVPGAGLQPRSSASGLMKYMSASLLMQRRSSQDLSKNVVIRTRSSVMKDRRLSYRISQNSSCPKNIYINMMRLLYSRGGMCTL